MNSTTLGVLVLIILIGSLASVVFCALKLFRYYIRCMGMEKVMAQGAVLGDEGIELPKMIFLGVKKIKYQEIEAVELLHFPTTLMLRYRYAGKGVCCRPGPGWFSSFKELVVIKLKPPRFIEYEAFNPRNATTFYNELKARIETKYPSK